MVSQVALGPFVKAVLNRTTSLMPLGVRQLPPAKMAMLSKLCESVAEITAIFGAVNRISYTYRDKEGYVIKRLY